ncbi:glycosyltransferase family 2 protein [Pedobacter jamesrossensis]|uniref:Glycosyltransferase family 2 protein n=1 Tax=Pedobacter jamesrossensis TaxID=1908238 RepID=A0ABV8NHE3_9SPHI
MKKEPLIWVIVPCYNHENYITQCIESIINQSYKNFELVVIDDGSTDKSREVLIELQNKYAFHLEFQKNSGVANTLNHGLQKYANEKYVTFCASDDFWPLDKLEKQVEFMEQHPECRMCYGKAIVVDEFGNERTEKTTQANLNLKGGAIFQDILFVNFHLPVTYFFRRNVFEEVGYYRPNLWTEDFYMNLRISELGPVGFLDEYLTFYRLPQVKGKIMPNLKMINAHLECIEMYKHSEYYEEAIKNWHYRNFRMLSGFTASKRLAYTGMLRNCNRFFTVGFLKSLTKLVFKWV